MTLHPCRCSEQGYIASLVNLSEVRAERAGSWLTSANPESQRMRQVGKWHSFITEGGREGGAEFGAGMYTKREDTT